MGIESKDVASYEVNKHTNGSALIESINKINF
jgi:hypothetical protein